MLLTPPLTPDFYFNETWSQLHDELLCIWRLYQQMVDRTGLPKAHKAVHSQPCECKGINFIFVWHWRLSVCLVTVTVWGRTEWSWRRTRVWILHYWQRIHLFTAFWRASKHLLQWWMERQVRKWSETGLICVESNLAGLCFQSECFKDKQIWSLMVTWL